MEEGVAKGSGAAEKKVVVGITGASGVIYGVLLVRVLAELGYDVDVMISQEAEKVAQLECSTSLRDLLKGFRLYREYEVEAPPSSSSYLVRTLGVIISPCSQKTLALIAHGISQDLISRSALSAIRIRKPLVLVIRETPLSTIDLENALKVSRAGGIILPASPGFYHMPRTIKDMVLFVVGKALDALGIQHDLYKRWNEVRRDPDLCGTLLK